MMRKLLTGVCVLAFITATMIPPQVFAGDSSKDPPPTKVTNTDYDYSGKSGNAAAQTDTALTGVSATFSAIGAAASALSIAGRLTNATAESTLSHVTSCLESFSSPIPRFKTYSWWIFFVSLDPYEAIMQLGHAAVNQFMRDETAITASFVGAQGHTTNKWIGPPSKNKEVVEAVLAEFSVPTQKFDEVAFDASEYDGLSGDGASARQLMEYRNKKLVEEQRSLENVTDETWGIRYRAQRRAIAAMVTAMKVKETLDALANADDKVKGEYGSKTQAVASVASRRVLYDALLYLKMNVLAARTKMRAELLELDFTPVKKDNTSGGGGANSNNDNNANNGNNTDNTNNGNNTNNENTVGNGDGANGGNNAQNTNTNNGGNSSGAPSTNGNQSN